MSRRTHWRRQSSNESRVRWQRSTKLLYPLRAIERGGRDTPGTLAAVGGRGSSLATSSLAVKKETRRQQFSIDHQ